MRLEHHRGLAATNSNRSAIRTPEQFLNAQGLRELVRYQIALERVGRILLALLRSDFGLDLSSTVQIYRSVVTLAPTDQRRITM